MLTAVDKVTIRPMLIAWPATAAEMDRSAPIIDYPESPAVERKFGSRERATGKSV